MSLLRRIADALSDGSVESHDPNDVLRLASVPLASSMIVTAHLADHGVESTTSEQAGRGLDWVGLFVRRSDFERSCHVVTGYYAQLGDLTSLRDVLPVKATLADVSDASDRLLAELRQLENSALRRPSRLPDWTVGHVSAHIALNAEAFVRCAEDLHAGRVGVMYPSGIDGRSADIDRLSHAGAASLVDRVAESNERFNDAWRRSPPQGTCCTAPGASEFASSTIVDRRLREVEVHGTDTGLAGLGPENWSDGFVVANLAPQWATVERRTAEPVNFLDDQGGRWRLPRDSTEIVEPVERTRREILAWILDRRHEPELATLKPWGDQSRRGR